MEVIPGIPGAIPPLAVYPTNVVSRKISVEDWQAFLDAWIFSIEFRLRLKPEHFSFFKLSQAASGVSFLSSYLEQYALRREPIRSGSKEARLHHDCYFLLRRLLLETSVPYDCSSVTLFQLLGAGSIAFHAIPDWKTTLKAVWQRGQGQVSSSIEAWKASIIKADETDLVEGLHQLTAFVRCLPNAAVIAATGSDYLESSMSCYDTSRPLVQKALTESLYYGFQSLMTDSSKHVSLLLDILFELKAGANSSQKVSSNHTTLLSSLLCTTPFLRHLKTNPAFNGGKRGQSLIQTLTEYRQLSVHLHPISTGRTASKGKGKGKAKVDPQEDMNIHAASQISEIHELFPDLPDGHILKLLDHFSGSTEAVIAALLEPDTMPVQLREPAEIEKAGLSNFDAPIDLAPRSTPPPSERRKNVFDDDDFDKLQISSARVHRGRRDIDIEQETANEHSRSKAAILAALAAFDADDDERDDTYDVADVGGAVDNTLDSDERRDPSASEANEEILFRAWLTNSELFSRESKTRMSSSRRQLVQDTKMDNEQIEGWAIMLGRDTKMQDRLRQKYSTTSTFHGNQQSIASTKWRAPESPPDSQDEGLNKTDEGRRVGAAGIRGNRNWNRGRGRGSTSGPADEHSTQMARKRKEQGRGRGGAANRREGRAKKMGRGMGPVTQA